MFSAVFLIFRKLSENSQRISREIITHKLYQEHFLEFYNVPKFSENLETILDNVRFQLCLAAASVREDGAILPDDQPIKLPQSRAVLVAI